MAIDGKSIKSTLVGGNSSYQNFVSIVSVYSHARGPLVRHKVMENQQQSEICVVEELIRGLSGSQVVIERGCTALSKKTLALIIDGGNDYIVTIKKNQSTLFKAAQKLVESSGVSDSLQSSEHLHGRTTTRRTKFMPFPLNYYLFGRVPNT
jgi:hypothetical protein